MEALLEPLRELAEIEEIQNEKKKEAGLIQICLLYTSRCV